MVYCWHRGSTNAEEDMLNQQPLIPSEDKEPKKQWQPPTIEEIDYGSTEAAYIGVGALDFGIYSI